MFQKKCESRSEEMRIFQKKRESFRRNCFRKWSNVSEEMIVLKDSSETVECFRRMSASQHFDGLSIHFH
jgi:hypothetical protein